MKYIIKYEGSFGFIKPWSAVRDTKTKSCFYLTPSILMGIERKLFPELSLNDNGKLNKILRYRLNFQDVTFQKELTRSINYINKTSKSNKKKYFIANTNTVERGLLLNPVLYIMISSINDIDIFMSQHICLCRNEDILFPTKIIEIENDDNFNTDEQFYGYESFSCDENDDNSILCGLNKYTNDKQYIQFKMFGTPDNLKTL